MRRIYIPLLLLLCPFTIGADNFSDVLNTIVTNNLTTKYNVASDYAKIEEMKGENQLEAPEVEFERVWGAKNVGNKWGLSVTQSFDWPGVYKARKEAISKSEYAMHYLRESSMLDVRMEVRLALIDLIYTRQKMNVTKGLSESMGKLMESYRIAAERGEETRLDYNKVVIEKIQIDREFKSLEGQFAVAVSSLESLNGGESVTPLLDAIGDSYPDYTLSQLAPTPDAIKEKDPQYAAAMASIEANKSLVKVEKMSRIPGFSIGYVHENEMGDNFNGFSFGITLPFLTGKSKVRAANLQTEALNFEAEIILTQRVAEMNGVYKQAQAIHDFINEYEPVINSDSNLLLLKKAFDGGQISLLTYLQEVAYFRTAYNDYLDTVYEYQQALAKLSRYM